MGFSKQSILFLLLIAILVGSCATTQSISNEVRTKEYQKDYNTVFRAIVQTLSDAGYIINDADSENGIINTDYSQASEWEAFWSGDERTKVNAFLTEKENSTQVRLTVSVQNKAPLTGWQNANMTKSKAEEYYEKLFQKIESNL